MKFIQSSFASRNNKDKSVLKNIGLGFLSKGLSIIISFLQVPVTLSLLSKSEYGVWITIFSVIGWLSFFDIGMGNGFRNKLTEALTNHDYTGAKKLVSTTYISLAFIFSGVAFLFLSVSFFVPWQSVFKAPPELSTQLLWVMILTVSATALNFVAALIHTILAAHHKTGKSSMLFLISQSAILLILFCLRYADIQNKFAIVASVLSLVPFLLNVGLNIYFFAGEYKAIAPSIKSYEKEYLKKLMNLGGMFFVIQISAIVMYATDNFIITQFFGPESVVSYSLVYRYYSVLHIVFGILTTPLWTMFVTAYIAKDYTWINSSIKRLLRVFYSYIFLMTIMILLSGVFFTIWIGPSFKPPLILNFVIAVYILMLVWGNIWVLPLNASGKIAVQTIVSILQAILNVPVILLVNYFLNDLSAVVIGNIICVALGSGYIYFYYKSKFKHLVKIQ